MGGIDARISDAALDIPAALREGASPECGAIAAFVGTVRKSGAVPDNDSKEVVGLEYEAHPTLAGTRIEEVAREASERWELHKVIAVHRTGPCELGEPTVVVVTSAPHRGDALEACRWLIDTIKAGVPIWKKEIYADGSSWVGAEAHG